MNARVSFLRGWQRIRPLAPPPGVMVVLYGVAPSLHEVFLPPPVFVSLLTDNAFLGIAALGATLVIFSGGIDLSVGAVIGFTSIFVATLIERHAVPPLLAWVIGLGAGTVLGGVMGWLIHHFKLPPFLITLAGMFFARGLGFWIGTESIGINSPLYARIASFELGTSSWVFPANALILLGAMGLVYLLAHHSRFGRNLLAIGGSEHSALLMGLPIGATKIAVYALSSFCAASAGIVATFYTGSGNPSMGVGLELDAIAIVVIGGTLLSGGRGHILGTVLGILVFGTLQAAILFDGRLSSWWMRIVVGGLILVFILLQRLVLRHVAQRVG